jgi:hypothetical protein
MGFDAFRLSNYPAHAAMTDLISLVPRMTADSSGGFTASASSSLLNPAWQPFSMDNEGNLIDVGYGGTGGWACGVKPTVGSPQWISIVFPSQLSTSKVCLSLWNSVSADWAAFRNAYSILKDFEIQTFDGTTWTTQVTVTNFNYTAYEYGRYNFITFNLPTPTTCVGMRIKITALHLGSSGWDNGLIRCIYLE